MNKVKLYGTLLIALLLMNIGLVIFMFLSKTNEHQHLGPKQKIISALNLDEDQVTQYEKLIPKHQQAVQNQANKIANKKMLLFSELNNQNNEKKISSITNELSILFSEMELIHFNHFKEIKSICREDQLDQFNELTAEIPKLFRPRKPHHKVHNPKNK